MQELDPQPDFLARHLGPSEDEIASMLSAIGYPSLEELCTAVVPAAIRTDQPLKLPNPLTEVDAIAQIQQIANLNRPMKSLIGLGYHNTVTPAVVVRRVLENPGWYTAYTPYQPEISQGRLEALLNYQTLVCDLTGMEISNSSLLDESTAAAEAMTMARRLTKTTGTKFFVDSDCYPQTIDVVRTRAEALGINIEVGDAWQDLDAADCYGVLVQYPGCSGDIRDISHIAETIHGNDGILCVASDLLALCLLTPPGELGADLVVGTSQRLGVPLGFGGPHAGYLAAREDHKRALPGRLVGVSVDSGGRPATRLALQTREQHIRREKATSNICTAQVLLAVIASMYAVYHGPDGLKKVAQRIHSLTATLATKLESAGFVLSNQTFFDTLTIQVPGRAAEITQRALVEGINIRVVDSDTVAVTFDETCDAEILEQLGRAFLNDNKSSQASSTLTGIPQYLSRSSSYLDHPVFNTYRSETEMLRYIRRLADKDIALDRSMIPLGSCTMKLNATSEMEPITWPEFADIHPFAPLDQARGYMELIEELSNWLLACTGYDQISLQPNAGSQGEFAGLLAIKRYHESRGEDQRNVCLIPSSAHGTNAASAIMAGLKVIVVECDHDGDIDLNDLEAKVAEHEDVLAGIMVTYPSTHGVFEEGIVQICRTIHKAGGQVYVDGANLNALVGLAAPGQFGADVSHLNLHKTFCIPHGGGGPGIGPVAVREHLAPFLPNHPLVPEAGPATGSGAIAAAPWGSAGILPIPWMYIAMMGAEGLTRATAVAIVNANYIALRLDDSYPVLYRGQNGLVAHECILDLRQLSEVVTVEDIAKRLIDYGFHAPTMSFPVPGTLMVEPTESESKQEIDRFCDAMIQIRQEIARIESGEWPADDNPLVNAPHPAEDLLQDDWRHPYTRQEAAFPLPSSAADKYWPPVSRIDGAHGDRNLVCNCPSPRSFEDLPS
ncbi:MAG: aminomethyl-transferring glycine dehydrogenase [Acidimicrobiales bacterium]|jgi:glycine dehydrogenase|nr:aminomethyl-transferring glycine dehydrogenase [Acidimicrobiales bacterium]MDP6902726.1 aminomethyl-transferring glycine dehydrogenase [Acidimicrobiales bacterium]HJM00171.1 aminomethyl-transferring glycine dehydrogenase [Acidimicrobiales bacterium]